MNEILRNGVVSFLQINVDTSWENIVSLVQPNDILTYYYMISNVSALNRSKLIIIQKIREYASQSFTNHF